MSKLLKSQAKIRIEDYSEVPKEVIEKRFIMDFLNQVPLGDLKNLVFFEEINPNNKDHWNESNADLLEELMYKKEVRLECGIKTK